MDDKDKEQQEVDPRYGIPKRKKFDVQSRRAAQAQAKAMTSTSTSTLTTTNIDVKKRDLAGGRKYFDSADWATSGEINRPYPKLFMDLEMYSFLQRHAHPKTVERYMLSRGRRHFDSADWFAYGQKDKPHPKLLAQSPSYVGTLTRNPARLRMTKSAHERAYFDSADWAMYRLGLEGKPPTALPPKLGFT